MKSYKQLLISRQVQIKESSLEAVKCTENFPGIDFFQAVPSGSDAYLLSHVLHDWTDEQCLKILKNCHRAMEPGVKLLVIEMLVPAGNSPSVTKLLDLEMLVITGGRERTETEYKTLFETAGFTGFRVIPTKESVSVLETVK